MSDSTGSFSIQTLLDMERVFTVIPKKIIYEYYESPDPRSTHTISRSGDMMIPTAIATIGAPLASDDSLIIIISETPVFQIPISILSLAGGRSTYVEATNKHHFQFDLSKWIESFCPLGMAFHEFHIKLQSNRPFFIQIRFSHLESSERRSDADRYIRTTDCNIFHQTITSFINDAAIMRPRFRGVAKGFIIEAPNINHLQSFQITFNCPTLDNIRRYGPDQIATLCHRLSDTCLWVPFDHTVSNPFSRDPASFVGGLKLDNYRLTFEFNFAAPQAPISLHCLQYNHLHYETGMCSLLNPDMGVGPVGEWSLPQDISSG